MLQKSIRNITHLTHIYFKKELKMIFMYKNWHSYIVKRGLVLFTAYWNVVFISFHLFVAIHPLFFA